MYLSTPPPLPPSWYYGPLSLHLLSMEENIPSRIFLALPAGTITVRTVTIENDGRRSRIPPSGLREESIKKKLSLSALVETNKKENTAGLTRRGNPNVLTRFSIILVLTVVQSLQAICPIVSRWSAAAPNLHGWVEDHSTFQARHQNVWMPVRSVPGGKIGWKTVVEPELEVKPAKPQIRRTSIPNALK